MILLAFPTQLVLLGLAGTGTISFGGWRWALILLPTWIIAADYAWGRYMLGISGLYIFFYFTPRLFIACVIQYILAMLWVFGAFHAGWPVVFIPMWFATAWTLVRKVQTTSIPEFVFGMPLP